MDLREALEPVAWMFAVLELAADNFSTLTGSDELAAWEIASGWAAAGAARAWARNVPATKEQAAELDSDLQLRAGTAKHKAADGARLVANPTLLTGVERGRIGHGAAQAVARQLQHVPAERLVATTEQVVDEVVRDRGRNVRTETWAAEARRIADAEHAEAAKARAQAAFDARSFTLVETGDDMCRLTAEVRVDRGRRILARAEALARRREDPRLGGADRWRQATCDAFTDICLGGALPPTDPADHQPAGHHPASTAREPRTGSMLRSPQPDLFAGEPAAGFGPVPGGWAGGGPLAGVVFLTVSREAAEGTTETPALLHGVGKVSAALARSYLGRPDVLVVRVPLDGDGRMDTTGPPPCDPGRRSLDLLGSLWRIARDHTCRYQPGCRTPAYACDGEHVRPWADGGPSSTRNVASACGREHALKNTTGCTVTGDANGTLTITLPSGRVHESRPPVISPEHLWGTKAGPGP